MAKQYCTNIICAVFFRILQLISLSLFRIVSLVTNRIHPVHVIHLFFKLKLSIISRKVTLASAYYAYSLSSYKSAMRVRYWFCNCKKMIFYVTFECVWPDLLNFSLVWVCCPLLTQTSFNFVHIAHF